MGECKAVNPAVLLCSVSIWNIQAGLFTVFIFVYMFGCIPIVWGLCCVVYILCSYCENCKVHGRTVLDIIYVRVFVFHHNIYSNVSRVDKYLVRSSEWRVSCSVSVFLSIFTKIEACQQNSVRFLITKFSKNELIDFWGFVCGQTKGRKTDSHYKESKKIFFVFIVNVLDST
jgi:hypothetical protein